MCKFGWGTYQCNQLPGMTHLGNDLQYNVSLMRLHRSLLTFTFTFTFGEDSMLSSAEAIIKFGPRRNPEITERLYESL